MSGRERVKVKEEEMVLVDKNPRKQRTIEEI